MTNRVEDLLRELAPQVLGAMVRRLDDFATAEDVVQEALIAAATQWPSDGIPENPRGWLISVARRRYVDVVRGEVARREREEAVARLEVPDEPVVDDDTLHLLFLCAHPILPAASAIALTLRAVGGLTTDEIARAFLVPEATMSQRITRAKKRLAGLDRPFASAEYPQRLAQVLRVLYLMFTEGHTATSGSAVSRGDLADEAILLTRKLHRSLPDDTEVVGLLALLLLADSRRAARTGTQGELIPLADQDRGRWNREQIVEGVRLATAAMTDGLRGEYAIQAAIAALHAQAASTDTTDWQRILALYRLLDRVAPSPLVTLNCAVAVAMVHGPRAGLDLVDTLETELSGNHRLHAVRGHLYEMSGEHEAAVGAYTRAARGTTSTPERDYLTIRAARIREVWSTDLGEDAGLFGERNGGFE